MKGLWLENQVLTYREDLPKPEPSLGESLIKVQCAGICNTDLELCRGYYPYAGIPGHEFVGIVESGPAHLLGQRVVGEINASCGSCAFCEKGLPTHCENRSVLGIVQRNGAFAEYLSLPSQNLHVLPDHLPTVLATFTEPVAAALEIQQQISVQAGHRVLVVGDGKLGQLIAQTLALTGCDVLAIGRHRHKLANLEQKGIRTGLKADIGKQTFDIAVECTGNNAGFAIALQSLKPRGVLVLKSTYAGQLEIDASKIVVDEISVVGSRCGPFAPAIELLSNRKVNVEPMIQAEYPIEEGLKAFEHAQKKGTMKVLLTMT